MGIYENKGRSEGRGKLGTLAECAQLLALKKIECDHGRAPSLLRRPDSFWLRGTCATQPKPEGGKNKCERIRNFQQNGSFSDQPGAVAVEGDVGSLARGGGGDEERLNGGSCRNAKQEAVERSL